MTIDIADILGCWRLAAAYERKGDVVGPNPFLGESPTGYLHYLAGSRVAVTVALADRKPYSTANRRLAPMEELAASACTFDAYAGTFRFPEPGIIAHHIEISTDQGDVGTDLVRRITLEGDTLTLYPVLPEGEDMRWLVWQRLPPIADAHEIAGD